MGSGVLAKSPKRSPSSPNVAELTGAARFAFTSPDATTFGPRKSAKGSKSGSMLVADDEFGAARGANPIGFAAVVLGPDDGAGAKSSKSRRRSSALFAGAGGGADAVSCGVCVCVHVCVRVRVCLVCVGAGEKKRLRGRRSMPVDVNHGRRCLAPSSCAAVADLLRPSLPTMFPLPLSLPHNPYIPPAAAGRLRLRPRRNPRPAGRP